MEQIPVDSSNIASIGYDPGSQTLQVEFQGGRVYQYFDVPEGVFQEFLAASSKGKFFHANIKGSFRYARV
jgi:hypothetical protein